MFQVCSTCLARLDYQDLVEGGYYNGGRKQFVDCPKCNIRSTSWVVPVGHQDDVTLMTYLLLEISRAAQIPPVPNDDAFDALMRMDKAIRTRLRMILAPLTA